MKQQLYTKKIIFKSPGTSLSRKLQILRVLSILFISLFTFNAHAQTISGVTVNPTSVCPGSTLLVSFTVTNGEGNNLHFNSGTNYILYYSFSAGSGFIKFTNFTSTIVPSGDGGTAIITTSVTVPTTTPRGTDYKISIGSTGPTFDGSTGVNASVAFTINESLTASFTKVWASSCNGGTDGSLSVTASGGTSPYTYSWTGVNGFTATTPNIAGLSLGDYTVVVSDKNLCTDTISGITIKQVPNIEVGFTKSDPGCAGNDGSINAYRINGIDDGVNPVQFKLNNSSYQNSGNFIGLSGGNYTLTVKDSKGCTAVSSIIVLTQAPSLQFTPNFLNTNASACGNGSDGSSSLEITGGIPPYQYSLNGVVKSTTAATTYAFTELTANVRYVIAVTDSKGCSISKPLTLSKEANVVAQIAYKGNVSCNGGNDGFISIANGIGGASGFYLYSDDGGGTYQSKNTFYNLIAGTYNMMVKDSRGCSSSSVPVVITQVDPLVFKSNGYNTNVSACGGGSDGTITPVVTGGAPPYQYSIDGVEEQVTSAQYFTFTGLAAGTHTISVTDSKGCNTISQDITIVQVSAPITNIPYQGNETCIGANNGFISVATGAGGVPYYTFSKDGGMTYQTQNVFYDLNPGVYNVVVKDSRGCTSTGVAVTIQAATVNCIAGRNYDNSTMMGNRMSNSEVDNQSSKLLSNTLLELNAYPNPSSSEFTLDVKGNSQDKVYLFVTDVLGRRIYQVEGYANQQYKFGSNLGHGIYIVQVMQGDNIQTIQIVKE